jgi:uncharacterized protein YdaU (DUF1376 family)
METKSFFFGLHCADFLVDTNHLTNEALGCYIKLLCRMFLERECRLKYSHSYRICGFGYEGKKWRKLWDEQLGPLFIPCEGKENEEYYTNKRLKAEFAKINKIREQRSLAGKRGVLARIKYRSQSKSANGKGLLKVRTSNIDIEKERRIDRFSTVNNDKSDKDIAQDILNKQG